MLYVKALASPFTVNTMPEKTLKALADHGEIGAMLPRDGGDAEAELAEFTRAGVDIDALAAAASARGRGIVRQVVERSPGLHRRQERRAQEGELIRTAEPDQQKRGTDRWRR